MPRPDDFRASPAVVPWGAATEALALLLRAGLDTAHPVLSARLIAAAVMRPDPAPGAPPPAACDHRPG